MQSIRERSRNVVGFVVQKCKDHEMRKHTGETHCIQKVSTNHEACPAFACLAVHSSYSLGMLLQEMVHVSTEAVHQGQWRHLKIAYV